MIVHDVGALGEGRIDGIELSAVVEDFVHIANEIADGLEFIAQYFGLQCGEILTRRKRNEILRHGVSRRLPYPWDL